MHLTIVGLGLIGGSMALDLREKGWATSIVGVDNHPGHAQKALELGLVDEMMDLPSALQKGGMVIISTSVDTLLTLVSDVLDRVPAGTIVMDVGSTKQLVCDAVAAHPKRSQFVATHPMAVTEYSGPTAAVKNLFENKVSVICEQEKSSKQALDVVASLYEALKMRLIYMGSKEHDLHAAYVSHISHVISFVLALTVLEKEKDTAAIFDMASSGFRSTARLAKSHSEMWTPIFLQNAENVLDVLDEYSRILQQFTKAIRKGNGAQLNTLIKDANRIRKILDV